MKTKQFKHKNILILSLVMMGSLLLAIPFAMAENEPNDSFATAESGSEGIYAGSVNSTDKDYFVFVVPMEKDFIVTAKKTDSGEGILVIEGFDEDQDAVSGLAQKNLVEQNKEIKIETYNVHGRDMTYYIEISGEGEYEFEVEITDDTADFFKGLFKAGGIALLICISIPIIIIIAIIVIIIVISKKKKKGRR
jgi:hypothetical protein